MPKLNKNTNTEIRYVSGYNSGYTTEQDMASVVSTNILIDLGIFDRVTLEHHNVRAEKYGVGKNFKIISFSLRPTWQDPYIVTPQWAANGSPIDIEEALLELGPKATVKLAFNIDSLRKKELDLREYNKNGSNYS